jgi:hypothetical protein
MRENRFEAAASLLARQAHGFQDVGKRIRTRIRSENQIYLVAEKRLSNEFADTIG